MALDSIDQSNLLPGYDLRQATWQLNLTCSRHQVIWSIGVRCSRILPSRDWTFSIWTIGAEADTIDLFRRPDCYQPNSSWRSESILGLNAGKAALTRLIDRFFSAAIVAEAAQFTMWSRRARLLLARTRVRHRRLLAVRRVTTLFYLDARAPGAFGATLATVGLPLKSISFARPFVLRHFAVRAEGPRCACISCVHNHLRMQGNTLRPMAIWVVPRPRQRLRFEVLRPERYCAAGF